MQNIYLLLTALLLSTGLMAQYQPPKFVSYHDQLMQQSAIQQNPDGSRATVYKCIADRREVYDNPTSTWQMSDSSKFNYNTQAWLTTTQTLYHTGAGWNPGYRYTSTFDATGKKLDYTTELWVNHLGVFRNIYKTTYTYNGAGYLTEELAQNWDTATTTWLNSGKNTSAYNSQNQVTEYTVQDWNAGTLAWDNYYRRTGITYDANANQLTNIDQYWVMGAWSNNSKQISTYNAQNKLATYTYQNWNGMSVNWVNSTRNEYFYDANSDNTLIQYYTWNSGTTTWDVTGRTTLTYNGAHRALQRLYEMYSMGSYQYVEKYEYLYNAANNQTYMEYFNWNGFLFAPQTRYTSTYDANENITLNLTENYNSGNLTYENYSRRFYFYDEFTVSGIAELKNQLNATLYPNPSHNIQPTVSFTATAAAPLIVNIYNTQGCLLVQQQTTAASGANSLQLPTQTLTAGVYYVQVVNVTNQQSSVLKLIKE